MTDILNQQQEFRITRSQIAQHGLLHRFAGGERAGRKKKFVAAHRSSSFALILMTCTHKKYPLGLREPRASHYSRPLPVTLGIAQERQHMRVVEDSSSELRCCRVK